MEVAFPQLKPLTQEAGKRNKRLRVSSYNSLFAFSNQKSLIKC